MDVTVPESCGSPEMLTAAGTLSCATYCRELLWGGQSDRGSSRDVDCGSVTDFGCRAGGGAPRDDILSFSYRCAPPVTIGQAEQGSPGC